MLRRPVRQEKQYSYTDIDIEAAKDPSSPYGSTSSSTIAFKLSGLLKKQWQNFSDTNFAICQEPTEFVVEHKPIFDKEKLKLIQLSTFIEKDITCGTVTAIKSRSQYDGPFLNDQTFSPDWNQDSKKINDLIHELNKQIVRENLLSSSYGAPISSITSCFSSNTPNESVKNDANMTPMPIEMSQKTFTTLLNNPMLFLQSPWHIALLCVLCFAVIGLFATLSLLFAELSLGLMLFIFVVFGCYQLYINRESVMSKVNELAGHPAVLEATSSAKDFGNKIQQSMASNNSSESSA